MERLPSGDRSGGSEQVTTMFQQQFNRRTFLERSSTGLGVAALASLLGRESAAGPVIPQAMAKAKKLPEATQRTGEPSTSFTPTTEFVPDPTIEEWLARLVPPKDPAP